MLSIRAPKTVEELSSAVADRMGRVLACLGEAGARAAGPPFTRYHGMTGDEVDVEVGLPVSEPVDGDDDVEAGRLPGGEVIATVHRGPYEGLTEAGKALDRWLEENGREARGPNWELYRVNAGTVDDPSRFETDVVKPIR